MKKTLTKKIRSILFAISISASFAVHALPVQEAEGFIRTSLNNFSQKKEVGGAIMTLVQNGASDRMLAMGHCDAAYVYVEGIVNIFWDGYEKSMQKAINEKKSAFRSEEAEKLSWILCLQDATRQETLKVFKEMLQNPFLKNGLLKEAMMPGMVKLFQLYKNNEQLQKIIYSGGFSDSSSGDVFYKNSLLSYLKTPASYETEFTVCQEMDRLAMPSLALIGALFQWGMTAHVSYKNLAELIDSSF